MRMRMHMRYDVYPSWNIVVIQSECCICKPRLESFEVVWIVVVEIGLGVDELDVGIVY